MKVSRRAFFTQVSGVLALGAISPLISSQALAEERRRARPAAGGDKAASGSGPLAQPLVDPQSDVAKAVKYVHSKADLKDATAKIERQGVAYDQQFCNNCSFYKEVGQKEGAAVGSCTIFPQKLVKSQGFCTSWNKKA
ncbi:MAG: high-potential iron-sulfur protein [Bdellovibrionales bacterium]